MANALYDNGRERFLGHASAQFNWLNDSMRVGRVTSAYTFSAAHVARSNLSGEQTVASNQVLGTKTVTAGVADAADITFSAVNDGTTAALILYKHVDGVSTNDLLLAFIDTATGLPVVTNGGDITVTWDNGANKIFKL